MTTPPTDPEQSQPTLTPDPTLKLFLPQRKEINLAKFAAIFAVTLGITFGLCTVASIGGVEVGYFFYGVATIEAICAIGLLTVGVIAIIRGIRNQFRHD